MNKRIHAVLTGDVIKSSLLKPPQLEQVRDVLLQAVRDAGRWKSGLVLGKAEFFRGDAWQASLADPALALRVAMFIRARVKSQAIADTRIAIGIGTIDKVAEKRVSLSQGEAFVLSGHCLDEMPSVVRMTICLPSSTGTAGLWMPVVGQLCDALASQWKPRQAQIVASALFPTESRHEEIAEKLGVTKQAVTKSLRGAGWHSLIRAITAFELTDWSTICKPET